ncbi:hypothetical protein [Amycolatopsis granulosa]|uniref:hypothetical protein n=1 Tax=Amycolatopsis granulosa TaxID=185684 RepID=UPI001423FB0D|nr:hypothetical protein [Amycolatopsis granulosa]NIH86039.1 hypothetical protein [Amycolatopsis granulosa]
MARTVLRDRSNDLVRSVQLADRTGIIAASAPKPVERSRDRHPTVVDLTAVPGQLELAFPWQTVAQARAGEERRLLRRGRRNLIVAAAAVVLMGVGWVGGDTFGFADDPDPTPAVAVGAMPEDRPAEPVQPTPSASPAPQLPTSTTRPTAVPPSTTGTTPPVRKRGAPTTTSTSDRSEPRVDPVEETTTPRDKPIAQSLDDQIKHLFEVWTRNRSSGPGQLDRTLRSFGPFGH